MIHYGLTKTAQLALSRGLAETTIEDVANMVVYATSKEASATNARPFGSMATLCAPSLEDA
jgi:hypothetical protein